jgi:hypothetical protein
MPSEFLTQCSLSHKKSSLQCGDTPRFCPGSWPMVTCPLSYVSHVCPLMIRMLMK